MNQIKCPKCGTEIPVDKVIVHRVTEQIKEQVKAEAAKEYESKESSKVRELEVKLQTEKQKREDSEKKELELLKKQELLDEERKRWDLEKARQMMEERKLIEEKAQKDANTSYELKIAEKEKQLEDQKKLIAEMQRKAHQGSMQTQGEVLELSIEEMLRQAFPIDRIEPVPKGINGADIIQTVCSNGGQVVGKIVWETKRTKNWTEDWVQKLKDDCRTCHGDIAILISEILPKEVENFGLYKGIWVCNYSIIKGVASIIRNQLISVSNAMASQVGKDQKMEALYNYLTSSSFAQKVEVLVETFVNMKTDLDKEKIVYTRVWAKRESQLLRLTDNTAKLYGDIQGIAGQALPTLGMLELNSEEELSQDLKLF